MGDRDRFGAAAGKFRRLADVLAAAGNPRSAVARAEGYGIALAGELYGSINTAEINDHAITAELASYLRNKFLYGGRIT